MAYLDDLQPLQFGGISLPYQRIVIRGSQRDHVHEYPHVPGGGAEKLGRKLYEFTIRTRIDERIGRFGGRYAGRNLLQDLGVLTQRFENGDTDALYLPNIGEVQAYCTNWDRTLDVRLRSGEDVELKFREDQQSDFLTLTTLRIQATVVANAAFALNTLDIEKPPSIFAAIRDGVNQLLAFRDTAQMWAGFVADKITGLQALFAEADATLDLFDDPENYEVLEALKALWESVNDFASTALAIDSFETYTTPSEMTAAEASQAIYGETSYAIDLANWNSIGDMYSIPAGTDLRYIPGA